MWSSKLNISKIEIINLYDKEVINFLDISADYMYTLVETLVAQMGYQRNVTIFGAGYDFRKAPCIRLSLKDRILNFRFDNYFTFYE